MGNKYTRSLQHVEVCTPEDYSFIGDKVVLNRIRDCKLRINFLEWLSLYINGETPNRYHASNLLSFKLSNLGMFIDIKEYVDGLTRGLYE